MSASADGAQPVVTARQFRLRGGHDTNSSDSEEERGGVASRLRGGASAAATAATRSTDAPQVTLLSTAADATPASLPPRAGSSSSLELFSSSSSRSSSPACSELPPGLMMSTVATTAPKDLWGERLSGSSSNNGRFSDTYQRGHRIGNHERGDGDTAQTRQQLRSAGSPVGALGTSTRMRSAVEEERQTVPGEALAGDVAVVAEVSSTPSPTASASLALRTGAVQPRSAATGFFKGKEASPPTAIEGAAFTTCPIFLSAGSAGGMSRPAASATATAVPSSLGSPTTTGMGPIRTDAVPTVEAAVAPVYTGGPSEVVQESSRTSVGSVTSPTEVRKAPLASRSSSSSLNGDPVLAPVQIASSTSTGRPSGGAATATPGLSIRKLPVPFTTAAEVDTPPSSSSSALGSGSPVLSGPGSVVYNRVSAQGRGSVPSSVLEAPSRPKWCAPPAEHTASPSLPAAAAQSAAISAAPPPLTGPAVSTQAAHAAEPTPAAARASVFSTSQPFVNVLARPHRQAPRLPGATHTSAVLSLIEDDDEQPRCSSPSVSSAPSTEGNKAETGQPKTVSVQGRGPPSSRIASPPSPPTRHAASSAEGATPPLLSRSAVVTAAQRQREASLVIYDDRVPPAKRRAKRQARPMTGQPAAIALADPIILAIGFLKGLRLMAEPSKMTVVKATGEDRSAKLTLHSASNYTAQRLFSEPQPQHKERVDSYISGTGNGESVPCVVMRLRQQGAPTVSDVKATHGDFSSARLSSSVLPPAAASKRTAVSLLTDESVNQGLTVHKSCATATPSLMHTPTNLSIFSYSPYGRTAQLLRSDEPAEVASIFSHAAGVPSGDGGLGGQTPQCYLQQEAAVQQVRHVCTALICIFLHLIAVAGFSGHAASRSPEDLDEQWDDMRGATPLCTYAGARHYSWCGAPSDSRRPPRPPVSVSKRFLSPPTAPHGVAASGVFSHIRTPMCVHYDLMQVEAQLRELHAKLQKCL
ncbi:hypothetical protein CGC20_12115 [Leishmania donovani]|uniref:Uncharacterized protein n=1 Tax=Leishmania donovani TaxID=5661 RepID=A0A504XBQ1_LEIDO|nr:hypothetical protein CGC20_12115 [Leishmania donovani]